MNPNSRRPLRIMGIIFLGIVTIGGLALWLFRDTGIPSA